MIERGSMINKFYPREYVPSPYKIDYKKFFEKGYRGVLFDIDNTLVGHNADADEKIIAFLAKLKKIGFAICLLSNNKEERVKKFNEKINLEYIFKAGKPGRKAYIDGMRRIHCNRKNTFFVGDQIFTDIYGANRAGVYSILVQPVAKKEEIQIVLKRYLERIVLFFYKKSKVRSMANG